MKSLILLLLLLPFVAVSSPEPYMQKRDPGKLAVVVALMFECPITREEISAMTSDIMSDAGVQKVEMDRNDPNAYPALSIVAKCAKIPGGFLYDYNIDFFTYATAPDGSEMVVRLGPRSPGSFGQGTSESASNALRKYFVQAISDFITANSQEANVD